MWKQAGEAFRRVRRAATLGGGGSSRIGWTLLVAGLAAGGGAGGGGPVYVDADDSTMPAAVRGAVYEDAARLAAREVTIDPDARRSARLPVERIATFYDALVRVRNLDHPARDSVVTLYDIHTYPSPTLHRVLVGVAKHAGWTAAWSRGLTLTGHTEIDGIIRAYDLELEFFSRFPNEQRAVLFAPAALNILAVAERFTSVAAVEFALPFPIHGDGNDIRASTGPGGLVLEYSVGLDCELGCRDRHVWRFGVDRAGRVEYLGGMGPPVPAKGRITD